MIRFGVVGTNWITDRFLDAAGKVEGFELTAVFSRTAERAGEFAGKHGVKKTFTDLEEMAKSDTIDAVYIASPNILHAEQSILFMNNGKHVLCEKPAASNTKELLTMIQAAKENDVLLMEALKTTFIPGFQAIKDNLPKIGKVRRFVSVKNQYSSRYDAYREGTVLNAFKPQLANGSLMDIGVYCIVPIVALFGVPDSIFAQGMLLETGADGEGTILFKYEDMEAVAMYSKITNSNIPSEIQGEDGSIIIDSISDPQKVELHYRDGSIEDISTAQEENTMFYEISEFVDLVKKGEKESAIQSFRQSLDTMEILEEARRQIGIRFPSDDS
ncbi:Gfo/Idh/MocA family oxidoreductase [Rossellomorea vietnamensis]|uniref:Gfo/Idh/MocA family oxidoreductase n=1 Tax=Rossellomorea vietnamensis TaxID=218284 RepID=A0A5D4MFA4_9BACI|nr:Gfo/Idh/MocA family oxidoreductase [Rossellomorea vietnamensis]TYS00393.1 Gfo/Idh/MocA family oxidoreductase [Rossellomorea vietnamensis]